MKKILIIEDDVTTKQIFVREFNQAYQVLIAESIKEGKELIEKYEPDIIIINITMKESNELIKITRNLSKKTLIIATSALFAEESHRNFALSCKAILSLTNIPDLVELKKLINKQ